MKILSVEALKLPEVKVIRFSRFLDSRGYFTESYRKSDCWNNELTEFLRDVEFVQANESFSRPKTIRGLHFQWQPYVGKLIRVIQGHMIDLVLDIRKRSPNFGRIIAVDMPSHASREVGEWIWVPCGFAHGNLFLENTLIEYFCSGEYVGANEAGISPLAVDLDWSLCDPSLKASLDQTANDGPLMSDKDRQGLSLSAWLADPRSDNFIYDEHHDRLPEFELGLLKQS